MFDVGASELGLIAAVSVIVIGPKDLPVALRTVGRVIGQFRRMTGQFRAGLDTLVRQVELDEMEKQWREENEERARTRSGVQLSVFEDEEAPPAAEAEGATHEGSETQAPKAQEPEAPKPWVNPAAGLDCLAT